WMRMDVSSPNGITMGDASGVGPEILLKAFANGELRRPFVAYGDMAALHLYNERLGYGVALRAIARPADYQPGDLNVVDHRLLRAADITPGKRSQTGAHPDHNSTHGRRSGQAHCEPEDRGRRFESTRRRERVLWRRRNPGDHPGGGMGAAAGISGRGPLSPGHAVLSRRAAQEV